MDVDLGRKCTEFQQEGTLAEVENVKAHRTKKERQTKCRSSKNVTEGNERADELATDGAVLDGGDMAQIRASTVHQERQDVYAAMQYAVSFPCLVEEWQECEELKPKPKEKLTLVDREVESKKHSNGVVCGRRHKSLLEMRK